MALNEKSRGHLQSMLLEILRVRLPNLDGATEDKVGRFAHDPKMGERIEKALQVAWRDFSSTKPPTYTFPPIDSSSHSETPPAVAPRAPTSVASPLSAPCPAPAPEQKVAPTPPISANAPALIPAPAKPSTKPMSQSHPELNFRILNGKAGVAYRSKIDLVTVSASTFSIKGVDLPANLGLSFDQAQGEISGTPTRDGEFKVVVWYVLGDATISLSSIVNLVINPDPKSLWKDLPSKTDDPYWKPDLDSLFMAGDGVVLAAASKRGRSHAHVGSFRDDDFHLSYVDEGKWNIAIVSDGAGSAKFSRRGSQIICHDGAARLKALLAGKEGTDLIEAVEALEVARSTGQPTDEIERMIKANLYMTIGYTAHHVTRLIQEETKARAELGGSFKDYSSTAIIGLCRRFSFGVLCAAYWVGDGAVAVLRDSHAPILLGEADSGEFSGQTRFLDPAEVTQESMYKRIHFAVVNDFKAFVLMTDGVSDPFFETEANLSSPDKWSSLWHDVESKAGLQQRDDSVRGKLASWMDFWSPGNHDDRTIAAIY